MSAGTALGEGRAYGGRAAVDRRTDQRQRLLLAARDEFARRGYADTSVEHIVAGARVSRTTFYGFFENKEECLVAVYRLGAERLGAAVAQSAARALVAGAPPAALIRAEVQATLGAFAGDPAMARILLIEMVGASRRTERAHARGRAAAAAIIQAQMERYQYWRRRLPHHRRVASLAAMAAVGEATQDLVISDGLAGWESLVEPLSEFLGRALIDPAEPRRPPGPR